MKDFIISSASSAMGNSSVKYRLPSYLSKSVEVFSDLFQIPVTLFSRDNEMLAEYGCDKKICSLFNVYCDRTGPCRRKISYAGEHSREWNKPYVFLCSAHMTHIAVALDQEGESPGYLIAGPIATDPIDKRILDSFTELNNLTPTSQAFAKLYADSMKLYEPRQIQGLALMFYNNIIASGQINPNPICTVNVEDYPQESDEIYLSASYSGGSRLIMDVLEYVEENYCKKITLKNIEEQFQVNRAYFSSLFKRETGVPFASYLNLLKVQHACCLLKSSDLSIQEISKAVGFDDQSYFTKVFKKVTGEPPVVWRMKNSR